MTKERFTQADLSDHELLEEVIRLAEAERSATARLIAALAEVDSRRLYLGQGCSSLFVYCTRVLRLSEHAAYGRIEAARASRRFPALLEMLERSDLTLTSLCLLAPHLTETNHNDVLARARHRSKREVEEIVASLRPRPDVPLTLRKAARSAEYDPPEEAVESRSVAPPLADIRRTAAPLPPPRAAVLQPLAPDRYRLQLTIGNVTRDKLRRARDLMRHSVPSGDVAAILDRALDLLLTHLERQKLASSDRPRAGRTGAPGSRHIPAAVRRAVWQRDGGRCAFKGARGRCGETGFLEFHHVYPHAAGGGSTEGNIELRCRAHNQYEVDRFFGDPLIAREARAHFELNSVQTEVETFFRASHGGDATSYS